MNRPQSDDAAVAARLGAAAADPGEAQIGKLGYGADIVINHFRRRSAATATALGAALLLTGACGSSDDTGAPTPVSSVTTSAPGVIASAPAAGTSPGSTSAGGTSAGSTAQVCATAGKATSDFVTRTLASARSGDPAAVTKAYREGLTELAATLKAEAAKATDASLAAALRETATEAEALAAAPDPLKSGSAAFEAARDKLDPLCKP